MLALKPEGGGRERQDGPEGIVPYTGKAPGPESLRAALTEPAVPVMGRDIEEPDQATPAKVGWGNS